MLKFVTADGEEVIDSKRPILGIPGTGASVPRSSQSRPRMRLGRPSGPSVRLGPGTCSGTTPQCGHIAASHLPLGGCAQVTCVKFDVFSPSPHARWPAVFAHARWPVGVAGDKECPQFSPQCDEAATRLPGLCAPASRGRASASPRVHEDRVRHHVPRRRGPALVGHPRDSLRRLWRRNTRVAPLAVRPRRRLNYALRTTVGDDRNIINVLNKVTDNNHMVTHFAMSVCGCTSATHHVTVPVAATSCSTTRRPTVQALLSSLNAPARCVCPQCGMLTWVYTHPHIVSSSCCGGSRRKHHP
eukprot:PhM_4_TR405/c3_g3_i4/m.76086